MAGSPGIPKSMLTSAMTEAMEKAVLEAKDNLGHDMTPEWPWTMKDRGEMATCDCDRCGLQLSLLYYPGRQPEVIVNGEASRVACAVAMARAAAREEAPRMPD